MVAVPPANIPEKAISGTVAENKSSNSGMFFVSTADWFFRPSSPRIPPRFHHQNTTFNTHIFPNPHQKTPAKPVKTGPTGASDFFKTYSS